MVDKTEGKPDPAQMEFEKVSSDSDGEEADIDPALIARQKRLSIPRV